MAYRSHCNPLKLLNHPAHMACEALSESSSFIITIRRLEETVGIKSEYFERLSSRGRPKLTPRGDTYTFTGLQSLWASPLIFLITAQPTDVRCSTSRRTALSEDSSPSLSFPGWVVLISLADRPKRLCEESANLDVIFIQRVCPSKCL